MNKMRQVSNQVTVSTITVNNKVHGRKLHMHIVQIATNILLPNATNMYSDLQPMELMMHQKSPFDFLQPHISGDILKTVLHTFRMVL